MSKRFLSIVTLGLCAAGALFFQPVAQAEIRLTEATVQNLRNQVRLMLRGKAPQEAQKGNKMQPGDALTTAQKSWAELRFNDRSLARVGERALFRFLPNTRTFYLENGTALLLIPPGRGRSRVQTPNGAAGIRGSALIVRYSPDTDVTLIGALTNSQIEVYNRGNNQAVPLQAGQMAVIVQDQITQIFNFDLRRFYETSPMVQGLDLSRQTPEDHSDPDLALVQAETAEAVKSQAPLQGSDVVQTPAWIGLNSSSRDPYNNPGDGVGIGEPPLPPIALPGIDRNLSEGYRQITTGSEVIRSIEKGTGGTTSSPILASPTIPRPIDPPNGPAVSGAPTRPGPVPDLGRPQPGSNPKPSPPPIDVGIPTPTPPASPPPGNAVPPPTPPVTPPSPQPAPVPAPAPPTRPEPTPVPSSLNPQLNPNQVPPAPTTPVSVPSVVTPPSAPGSNAVPNPTIQISVPAPAVINSPAITPAPSSPAPSSPAPLPITTSPPVAAPVATPVAAPVATP
ncbi:MAG: FecR domain-containing protein, partial [Kovacikia sp.]